MAKVQKIGIMGGTFNPPHIGHIEAAKCAWKELKLDKVWFMPSNIPPHKRMPDESADAADRLRMTELATGDLGFAEVCDLELKRGGKSFTVDTLRLLKAEHSDAEFCLIMGTDMLLSFDTWYLPGEIASLCRIAVLSRMKDDKELLRLCTDTLRQRFNAKIEVIDAPVIEISSTDLRRMLREGRDVSQWVAPAVLEYIRKRNLYISR